MGRNGAVSQLVAIVVAAGASGCLSLSEQIVRKTELREFAEARELIVKNERPDNDFQNARTTFTRAVELEHGIANGLAAKGQLTKAREKATIGMGLAPWSSALKTDLTEIEERIGTVRQAEIRWADTDVDEPVGARQLLAALQPLGQDYRDSDDLKATAKKARKTLTEFWFAQLASGNANLDLQAFAIDTATLEVAPDACVRAVNALIAQPTSWLLRAQMCGDAPDAPGVPHAARLWVSAWVRRNLPGLIAKAPVSYESIQQFEQFREGLEPWPAFDCALATLHFSHAESRAGMGLAAVLGLLHAERGHELCANATRYTTIRTTALATLSNEKAIPITMTIDADPKLDPQLFEIVRSFVITRLRATVRGHIDLRFTPIGTTGGENTVYLSDIELYLPSKDQLTRVRSSYFSHNESVPNPRKQALRYQLDLEKNDLDRADSALSYAISSFNISPTEYGLQNVNRLRRAYKTALSTYNDLVETYNATPSTILQPVYEPYSFLQGKLWSGWAVDFSFSISSAKGSGVARSSDDCFVRLGTQFSDRKAEWRRDILPTIDLTFGRIIHHLDVTVDQLLIQVGPSLANSIDLTHAVGVTKAELKVARWLLHPWGATQQLGVALEAPAWSTSLGLLIRMPDRRVTPPKTKLIATKAPPTSSVEKLAEWSNGLVGRIQGRRSFASGALISGDGLVLTCAHCLDGDVTKIRFSDANWAGEYPIEVVFVNAAADVALIRAVGLRTPRWFSVRTDAPASKGEAIVALGNMSLVAGTGESTNAGVTAGVVADPDVTYGGVRTLIADVAVASGSSGGPLVSRETGEIVGVVTLVIKDGFSDGRAQAGTVCGATPANRLNETIGLTR